VPAGQNLVVTSITVTPNDSEAGIQDVTITPGPLGSVVALQMLIVTNTVSTQFAYPSGLIVPSGRSIYTTSDFSNDFDDIFISGYLTAN
jgi:hypothetical protein